MAKKATVNSVFGIGNNAASAMSLHDQLSQMLGTFNSKADEAISQGLKLDKIDKSEFGKVSADMILHLETSKGFAEGERKSRVLCGQEADAARQRFVDLAMNLPIKTRQALPTDEEGINALIAELEKIRYTCFASKYGETMPEKYLNMGKEQSTKFADGSWKFASFPTTKYQWNILSKLVSATKKHGFEAIAPKGKYIGDAAVQQIGKVPPVPGTPAGSDPVGRIETLIHQLTVAMGKIDLTAPDGETLVNKATMAILQVKAAQVNAAALASK